MFILLFCHWRYTSFVSLSRNMTLYETDNVRSRFDS